MSKITKFLLAGLCCLLIMVVPAWSVEVGDPMPDFAAQTFDGQQLGRTALMGSPVLLVFWNTWCANCLRELPEINRLGKKFGTRGLRIFAINTGYNDSESKARTFWKKYNYAFPAGFDHGFSISEAFAVRGVPTIFLVDPIGIVRYKQSSLPQDMEKFLNQLAP